MATKTELAWAAGLFEGEGCFTICHDWRRGGTQRCYAKLSMTDEDIVRRFAKIIKIGTIIIIGPRKSNHSKQWSWQVSRLKDVKIVYNKLCSQLGPRRTQRGLDVITEMEEYYSRPWGKRSVQAQSEI